MALRDSSGIGRHPRKGLMACAKALEAVGLGSLCTDGTRSQGEEGSVWEEICPLSYSHGKPLRGFKQGVTRPHACLKVTQALAWRMDWSWGDYGSTVRIINSGNSEPCLSSSESLPLWTSAFTLNWLPDLGSLFGFPLP